MDVVQIREEIFKLIDSLGPLGRKIIMEALRQRYAVDR